MSKIYEEEGKEVKAERYALYTIKLQQNEPTSKLAKVSTLQHFL